MKKRISMIIYFICLVVLVGCSQSNPEDTISSCFNDIKNGGFYNINQYFASEENMFDDLTNNNEEILKQAFSKLDYKILESNINGQVATVRTKIISPDIPGIMGMVMTSDLKIDYSGKSRDEIAKEIANQIGNIEKPPNDNKIIQIINSKDIPLTTNEININLKLVNNKWFIVLDSSFIRAITGNFINSIN